MANYIDNDGNQITSFGKIVAGTLLVLFTALATFLLIALWPDRIPAATETKQPYYKMDFFHVRLAICMDSCSNQQNLKTSSAKKIDTAKKNNLKSVDSATIDTSKKNMARKSGSEKAVDSCKKPERLIHLNTLLLIMVALAGFLGNMIHISTSFTTFLGSGQFKSSWYMWYIVKPFTAAALAIAMYFVVCGGFLTMNNNPSNVNIYGLLTLAILTGLFTDRTTLKLKEVFEVLLKPKEDRADTLVTSSVKIITVEPSILKAGQENTITVKGENMQKEKLKFLIDDQEVAAEVSAKTAVIKYVVPKEVKTGQVTIIIKNEKGIELFKITLTIKKD